MNKWLVAGVLALTASSVIYAAELTRPKAGKVEIFPLKDIRPGMTGTAWTVFEGTEPEPVPIEIVGVWKNGSGPRQDVILAKMGGKAKDHQCRRGHERQPGLYRRKAGGRGRSADECVFSGRRFAGLLPLS